MLAIGTVSLTVNHPNFDYAVVINRIGYLVKNAEEVVIEEGQPVLVQYAPADQFCKVIELKDITRFLPLGMTE